MLLYNSILKIKFVLTSGYIIYIFRNTSTKLIYKTLYLYWRAWIYSPVAECKSVDPALAEACMELHPPSFSSSGSLNTLK